MRALASILACGTGTSALLEQLGQAFPSAVGPLMLAQSRLQQGFLLGACE